MKLKYTEIILIVFVALLAVGVGHGKSAQNPSLTPSTLIIPSNVTHANCPAVAAGSTIYCWAGDGFWESDNGGAYFQHTAVPPPQPAPVTSVNGKTGAVVLNANTTLQ